MDEDLTLCQFWQELLRKSRLARAVRPQKDVNVWIQEM